MKPKKLVRRLVSGLLLSGLALAAAASAALIAVYVYFAPSLPSAEVIAKTQLETPLVIYSKGGESLAQFGEKRRTLLSFEELPKTLIDAFVAAEDDRFFTHPGVDYQGLIRAAVTLLRTGEKREGGSTITMQMARNFYLTNEKTYARKIKEIFLALRIEQALTKEEILTRYLNRIFMGHRAYGVASAARVYFGRDLGALSLAEMALLAGLPKAPSDYNPLTNPAKALARREYVLTRMKSLGYITAGEFAAANHAPLNVAFHPISAHLQAPAPYAGEEVRRQLVSQWPEGTLTRGLHVTTTLDAGLQRMATAALRQGLVAYDQRHGWRGPEAHTDIPPTARRADYEAILAEHPPVGGLLAAVVIATDDTGFDAVVHSGHLASIAREPATSGTPGRRLPLASLEAAAPEGQVRIGFATMQWAREYLDENRRGPRPSAPDEVVTTGDVVRILPTPLGESDADEASQPDGRITWSLAQQPAVEGALVAIDKQSGAIRALVGGFDFERSEFNRATQAQRQPGSGMKPFVYSAALDAGLTPATLINDAPVVYDDPALDARWRPENYSRTFYGPTRLREALVRSRNLVSIRVLRRIGIERTVDYLQRFGFAKDRLPRNLTLALGTPSLTPMDVARGFATFANGGFLVEPHLIERIEGPDGAPEFVATPRLACPECTMTGALATDATDQPPPEAQAPLAIEPGNAFIMGTILRDVVQHGTGRRALQLGRQDVGGKTGTTNDQRDAWFSGFGGDLVVTVWVGFDDFSPLGRRETGARAALPIWIKFMEQALVGIPDTLPAAPPDTIALRVHRETGRRTQADDPEAFFEWFLADHLPPAPGEEAPVLADEGNDETLTQDLF